MDEGVLFVNLARTDEVSNLIAEWLLNEPPKDTRFASFPTEVDVQSLMTLQDIPLLRRPPIDGETYNTGCYTALARATAVTEDQLSFHMSPMLKHTGINVRAHLYQHALSRAGLDKTPLRDILKTFDRIVDEVSEHDWFQPVDFGVEEVTVLPPPTAPELEDPMNFDLEVLGTWDYLLSYVSDEYKEQVIQQSVKEGVSVGYRHARSSKRQQEPPQDEEEEEESSSSTFHLKQQ